MSEARELTEEEIEQNKEDFLNILIPTVEMREGSNAELLQKILINSDFFIAPASAMYHGDIKGGLCQHCLNVYYTMWKLNLALGLNIPRDKIVIVSLLHDFSKRNYYGTFNRNVKSYSESGKNKDELGRYDWVAVQGYKVKEEKDRFIYGSHEETAEFMTRQFMPLDTDESVAILHHMGGMAKDSPSTDVISKIYTCYPLAVLLHSADLLATYLEDFRI